MLPKTYWETMIKRTKYKPLLNTYKNELALIEKNNTSEQKPEGFPIGILEQLEVKAVEICRKFQKASSQVEGRNGYLSAINHNQRSFDSQRLEVLTVLHNFDTIGGGWYDTGRKVV